MVPLSVDVIALERSDLVRNFCESDICEDDECRVNPVSNCYRREWVCSCRTQYGVSSDIGRMMAVMRIACRVRNMIGFCVFHACSSVSNDLTTEY